MNSKRREQVRAIYYQIEELAGQEQDAKDNLPDNIQDSERAEQMQENVDELQEAYDLLEGIIFRE